MRTDVTQFIEPIERWQTLDRWSAKVRPIADRIVGSGRRRDLATGRWLGHAVHPATVLVPLGCWIGSAVVDAAGPSPGSALASRRLVGAGVVGAVPALATGAADWLDTRGAEQRVGTAHAILNNLTLAAMASSWALRKRGHGRAGVATSAIGLAGALAAGLLGGHMAYARGVGVSTTAFQAGPEEWTRLLDADELEAGRPTAAALDDVGFVAVRDERGVSVLENRCTHRGGPLSDGTVVGDCIECPWHGSRFSLADGSVAAGPASVAQPAYETRCEAGAIEIRRTEVGGLRRSSVGASG